MGRTPLLNLRVDEETKVVWERAADAAGLRLAEFIRLAVNEKVGGSALVYGASLRPGKKSYATDFKPEPKPSKKR